MSTKKSKSHLNPLYENAKFLIGSKVPCKWRDGKYRTFFNNGEEARWQANLLSAASLTPFASVDDAEIIEVRQLEKGGPIEYYVHYEECTNREKRGRRAPNQCGMSFREN